MGSGHPHRPAEDRASRRWPAQRRASVRHRSGPMHRNGKKEIKMPTKLNCQLLSSAVGAFASKLPIFQHDFFQLPEFLQLKQEMIKIHEVRFFWRQFAALARRGARENPLYSLDSGSSSVLSASVRWFCRRRCRCPQVPASQPAASILSYKGLLHAAQ